MSKCEVFHIHAVRIYYVFITAVQYTVLGTTEIMTMYNTYCQHLKNITMPSAGRVIIYTCW